MRITADKITPASDEAHPFGMLRHLSEARHMSNVINNLHVKVRINLSETEQVKCSVFFKAILPFHPIDLPFHHHLDRVRPDFRLMAKVLFFWLIYAIILR